MNPELPRMSWINLSKGVFLNSVIQGLPLDTPLGMHLKHSLPGKSQAAIVSVSMAHEGSCNTPNPTHTGTNRMVHSMLS